MKYSRKVPIALLVCCLCFVFITIPAYGYTDPNTVGLLSQVPTPLAITPGASVTLLGKNPKAALAGLARRLSRRSDV